jgi:hypothetical protein
MKSSRKNPQLGDVAPQGVTAALALANTAEFSIAAC